MLKIVRILPSICDNSTLRRPIFINFIPGLSQVLYALLLYLEDCTLGDCLQETSSFACFFLVDIMLLAHSQLYSRKFQSWAHCKASTVTANKAGLLASQPFICLVAFILLESCIGCIDPMHNTIADQPQANLYKESKELSAGAVQLKVLSPCGFNVLLCLVQILPVLHFMHLCLRYIA